MSEATAQAEILLAVGRIPGLLVWRQNVGKLRAANGRMVSFGVPGCPDIIGCFRGRFLGIEVKSQTGKQRDAQINFQRALERAGGVYVVCRSADEAVSAIEAIV